MRSILSLVLLAAAACAQNAPPAETPLKPPPEKVDKALRARIGEFYSLRVAGTFREAEALVAGDTKDYYYSVSKGGILSFEIKSISYFDKYKRASALIYSKRYIMQPGFTDSPMTIPFTDTWKIESGKWVWYVNPETLQGTALGIKLPAAAPGSQPAAGQPLPNLAAALNLAGMVRADRTAVVLKPGETTEIVFSSASPGMAVVSLEGRPEGFEIKPEQVFLKQNESSKVAIKALGGAATSALRFRIDPSGESIVIRATVAK